MVGHLILMVGVDAMAYFGNLMMMMMMMMRRRRRRILMMMIFNSAVAWKGLENGRRLVVGQIRPAWHYCWLRTVGAWATASVCTAPYSSAVLRQAHLLGSCCYLCAWYVLA
jgi:hypothetical protein